jgi:hypothetical protein
VRVRETLCRQTSVQCRCATVHQLNANLLFEISDLPTEGWPKSVGLLLGGDGQTVRVGHGDEVAECRSSITISHVSQAWAQLTKSFSSRPARFNSE